MATVLRRNTLSRRVFLIILLGVSVLVFERGRASWWEELRDSPGGRVHGMVQIDLEPGIETRGIIRLPDFEVTLRNAGTGEDVATATTDLFGRYMFARQEPGRYQLHWKEQNGWAAGESKQSLSIDRHTVYPTPIQLMTARGSMVVAGRVERADGSAGWVSKPAFGIDLTADVQVIDAADNASPRVRANHAGDFVIAGLKLGEAKVVSWTEGAKSEKTVFPGPLGKVRPTKVVMANHRPIIIGFASKRFAGRGETICVQVEARDADRDKLSYRWSLGNGAGEVVESGKRVEWRLPRIAGRYQLSVLCSDGNGGYDQGRVTVGVGIDEEKFTGRVVDLDGAPVSEARVSVNGEETRSDKAGAFSLDAPISARYVLTIRRAGYVPVSRVLRTGRRGRVWRLTEAQTTQVDPRQAITLHDRRSAREGRPVSGAAVEVPARALVDAQGKLPTGALNAAIATLDIANGEMPGDWGALLEGREVNLLSYGGVFVEFTDDSGDVYNLAPGSRAEVSIPAITTDLKSAPETIPLWSYDEGDGYWKIAGSAKLDPREGVYRGEVEHFSVVNTDMATDEAACFIIQVDPSVPLGAGLIARITDAGPEPQFPQDKRFELVDETNFAWRLVPGRETRIQVLYPSPDGEIVEVPNIVLEELIDGEWSGPLANNIVTAGAGSTDLWPDPEDPSALEHCKTVRFRVQTLDLGDDYIEGLDGNFFTKFANPAPPEGSSAEDVANAYYDFIGAPSTLGEWWIENGFVSDTAALNALGENEFPSPPTIVEESDADDDDDVIDYARTSFLNFNDLGSGRDMHFIKRNDGRIAAYVTNYAGVEKTAFDQSPSHAVDALAQENAYATVCMEFSPVAGEDNGDGAKIVKFFVYANNGDAKFAARQTKADLDGFGDKYVPGLCLNCHAGTYTPAEPSNPVFDDVDMGSVFRELDYATYKLPGNDLVAREPEDIEEAEKEAFKIQNLLVREQVRVQADRRVDDPTVIHPIEELIAGWYNDTNLNDDDDEGTQIEQDNTWTPLGWSQDSDDLEHKLYHTVVATSCRTCHVAFNSENSFQGLNWHTYDQFALQRISILGDIQGQVMPHALITYKNFWLSVDPNRAVFLGAYEDDEWGDAAGPLEPSN